MNNKTINNGDNYGNQTHNYIEINYGTTFNNLNYNQNYIDEIEKKKVEFKDIIKNKVIESIVAIILGVLSFVSKFLSESKIFDSTVNLCLFVIFIIMIILASLIFICSLYNIFLSLFLRKDGGFVEFKPVSNLIDDLVKLFSNNPNINEYRNTGKIYKNINNTIYELKGRKCPYCETGRIGHMNFTYNQYQRCYQLICSENPDNHILNFDYKKHI